MSFTVENNNVYNSDQISNTDIFKMNNNFFLQGQEQQKLEQDFQLVSQILFKDHNINEFVKQNNASIKQIITIQSYYRMYQCKIKYQKRKKWSRYRKCVIQELVESEFTYLSNLELIIVKVYDPLQILLQETDSKLLFRNLKQIYLLNKQFLIEISERFSNFNQHTCFGKIFDKYVLFFKIYFEYSSGFTIEIVSKKRKEIQQLDNFLKELEQTDIFKGGNLESYLIKPVQRLPKYVLLIKDLIKHTWESHPDYKQLQISLNKFIEVNSKIDILMDNVLKNQMLFELQQLYFDSINVSIVISTRRYVQSETINILVSNQQKSVIVYICNDMIILTQRIQNALNKQHEKLYEYLYLNENSYCKNIPETQYCKFLFTISSQEQSITFICQDAEQKQKLLILFKSLINEIKMKYDLNTETVQLQENKPIEVNAKGTEQRKSLLKSYTVYVMIIIAGTQKFTLLTRYSNLIKLENILREEYPEISIPHLSKNQWENNKKTQLIEARKIIIENFLVAVLNSPYVKENPEFVLKYLELPPSLYQTLTSSPIRQDRNSSRNKFGSSQFNTGRFSFNATLKSLKNSISIRSTEPLKSLIGQDQTITIKIIFLNDFNIILPISPELRVNDLIQMAAETIKLKNYEDFKLYFINEQEIRILDNNDCIPKNKKNKSNNEGVISKISFLFKEKHKDDSKLLFKKYLYLNLKQEKKEYQSDPVRLKLLIHQAFDDIKNMKYKLTLQEYCIYFIYYLIIKQYEYFKNIFKKNTLPFDLVKQLIPEKILKSEQEQIWTYQIYINIGNVKKEIEKIIKLQYKNLQGIKNEEQQFQYISELHFMESVQKNEFYGLHYFNIEISNSIKEILQKQYQCQLETQSTLGVKFDRFIIINIMEKKLEILLSDIINLSPFPFYFEFQTKQIQNDKIILKTSNGLEIQKLYELYSNRTNNLAI
ncbi:unnamed protein product [Paramecium sonneborni]|uniref:DH domain-containing protein n=1 Tax=Paramecium sonneborni TaxID=65129 RepID=A0A8S1QRM5_9CILI|nr:unnamed protein product [Paramecium sonneborni]